MDDEKLVIKNASINDLSLMLSWAQQEGWNPGLYDHVPFQLVDPKGFFVAYLNQELIACISTVRYPNRFAFLGFYIVAPEYRGKGHGLKLWQHGMQYLKGYNIGLDGVVSQQDNYKKSGFKFAYRNIRYGGTVTSTVTNSKFIIDSKNLAFDILLKYDKQMFPSSRAPFLAAWLNMPESKTIAFVKRNKLRGYGVIRKCYDGFKIGPLFADDAAIAEQLFLALSHHANQQNIFLDVAETNKEAIQLAEQFGLKPSFETARMYTGNQPKIKLEKIFGNTTFELG